MSNKKLLLYIGLGFTFICMVISTILILVLASHGVKRDTSSDTEVADTIIPTDTIPGLQIYKARKIYTNVDLPQLAIRYDPSWDLVVKEFSDIDEKGFKSDYFRSCDQYCMGLRFSKGDTSLNIIFDKALDDAGMSCSNSVSFEEIGYGWVRIKDSSGYFYTNQYQLDVMVEDGSPYEKWSLDDEWSVVNNTKYKICTYGSGYFRNDGEYLLLARDNEAVLVEYPEIVGNPSKELLKEIDEIVMSLN